MGNFPRLLAGMPMMTLTDLAQARLQVISFFLVVLLLASLGLKWIWNSLRQDFPKLPRMTFKRSCTITLLWGALFMLILTMISGARELMTPGAWERSGSVYKLKSTDQATLPNREERRARILALKELLWAYAQQHDNQFPDPDDIVAIPHAMWIADKNTGARYVLLGQTRGLVTPTTKSSEPPGLVAFEPNTLGYTRWVILANGQVTLMNDAEIQATAKRVTPSPWRNP
jgi:hypothetical protein